ncbi:glycosyltransferase family 4 protein [Sphingomonas sp. NFR15]|uniref:glycosyltransferase family 4 protein n=1 Tax=Sphingomonas sp. NFR15 TaxID=1566282 RepID=UPI00088FA401|nr:glycosyltransferase family 4 protein [Sphingomonas sp. NFR15]SDA22691.1 phosphatidylinositol alpha-1,6-mannosyltransferase [Sphingomonas sp. NFR15]
MLQRPARTVAIITCEYPPFAGGIGTYSVELARALAAAGCRVVVVAPAYDAGAAALPADVEHHFILRHHAVPPRAVRALPAILRGLPTGAIVLAADIRSLLLVRMLQPLHRRRYRVMVHGSEASKVRKGGVILAAARNAYLAAELVAYNSRATRDIFRAQLGRPRREAITYLGVGREWFDPPTSGAFDDAALAALPHGAPLFCSVGRLEPRKGHVETLAALALARDRHGMADPVYVVIGRAEDDGYARAIRAAASDVGVRIAMPGRLSIDDIKRIYRRAAAHLLFARALPGKIEGFGLVLLEAAAQGCPSVAAATGGIPEVLGDTGSLVAEGDIEGFAATIAAYAGDAALRADRGAAARGRASGFTWAKCARDSFPELLGGVSA